MKAYLVYIVSRLGENWRKISKRYENIFKHEEYFKLGRKYRIIVNNGKLDYYKNLAKKMNIKQKIQAFNTQLKTHQNIFEIND